MSMPPRTLPNFVIIGAEKAATTWLARGLGEHPAVYVPPEKEIFFFSSRFDRGLGWYADHFREWSGEARVGEATPVYLSHPEAAARIRETLGEIDLIVSLRHPVDRAYSAFWHNLRHGRLSPESRFDVALETDACEIRSRGEYARHLRRYLGRFRRERLLTLLYDWIRDDPAAELRRTLAFLDVDPAFRPSTLATRLNEGGADLTAATGPVRRVRSLLRSGFLSLTRRGVVPGSVQRRLVAVADRVARRATAFGPRARGYEPLDPALRSALFDRFYRPDVARLEDLVGMDLSWWATSTGGSRQSLPVPEALFAGRSRPW
jgi:hypothetical protein